MSLQDLEPLLQPLLWLLLLLLWVVSIPRLLSNNGEARMARLERKLDLILKNLGIEDQWEATAHKHIRELAHAGRKIEAIRAYREATGVGLKEAKEAVEEIERYPA